MTTSQVNINDFPIYLGTQLGVSSFIAGLLISLFVLMLVILPIVYLTKGKQGALYVIIGLCTLAPLVAIGWLDIWLYAIILIAIAFGMGKQLISFFSELRDR